MKKTCFSRQVQVCRQSAHTKARSEGRSPLRNTCDGENVRVHTVSKAGEGVRRPERKILRLRGRTERSTTHPASISAAATPATAFISCFARRVRGRNGASLLAPGCRQETVQRPAAITLRIQRSPKTGIHLEKHRCESFFLDGRRIGLPVQSASFYGTEAGAAAQVQL